MAILNGVDRLLGFAYADDIRDILHPLIPALNGFGNMRPARKLVARCIGILGIANRDAERLQHRALVRCGHCLGRRLVARIERLSICFRDVG